jgi:hypothetical protein
MKRIIVVCGFVVGDRWALAGYFEMRCGGAWSSKMGRGSEVGNMEERFLWGFIGERVED